MCVHMYVCVCVYTGDRSIQVYLKMPVYNYIICFECFSQILFCTVEGTVVWTGEEAVTVSEWVAKHWTKQQIRNSTEAT